MRRSDNGRPEPRCRSGPRIGAAIQLSRPKGGPLEPFLAELTVPEVRRLLEIALVGPCHLARPLSVSLGHSGAAPKGNKLVNVTIVATLTYLSFQPYRNHPKCGCSTKDH